MKRQVPLLLRLVNYGMTQQKHHFHTDQAGSGGGGRAAAQAANSSISADTGGQQAHTAVDPTVQRSSTEKTEVSLMSGSSWSITCFLLKVAEINNNLSK